MSWIAIRVTPASNRDGVIAALFDAGSQGIHEDGDAIVTHFPPGTDTGVITAAVSAADPAVDIVISETPEVSWEAWRANVGAHTVGALTVTPPWLAEQFDPAHAIVIDPAMAFGTGEHPTTRGMLRLMQQAIRAGDVVADLGAGSAVLSIAAVKLGASRVVAIELEPDAAGNAHENMAANNIAGDILYLEGDAAVLLPLVAPVRVVLANIVSSVLLPMLPVIAASLADDGVAILSGILVEEREVVTAELARQQWQIVAEDVEEAWWSVVIVAQSNSR